MMKSLNPVVSVVLALVMASLLFYASGGTFLGGCEQSVVSQCDIGYTINKYPYLFIHSPEQKVYARIGDILHIVASENLQTIKVETERRFLSWKNVPKKVTLFVPQDQEGQWQSCVSEIRNQFLRNNHISEIPTACQNLTAIRLPKFVN